MTNYIKELQELIKINFNTKYTNEFSKFNENEIKKYHSNERNW